MWATLAFKLKSDPKRPSSPFGTSTKTTYDNDHNPIRIDRIVQAGSSDPNTFVKKEYQEHESAEGRWFVRLKTGTDIFDHNTVYQYDFNDIPTYGTEVGNLMKITYPDVNAVTPVETFTYNSDGQVASRTNIEGIVTEYEYDSVALGAGRTATIVDANVTAGLQIRTETTYNAFGEPNSTTNAEGNVTKYEYDASGRRSKTTGPAPFSLETVYEYDEVGRLLKTKRITGISHVVLKESTYTATGQRATVRGPYPKDPNAAELAINYTQYQYDDIGRQWKVTDAEGKITETRYYPDNQVWKVIDANGDDARTYIYNDDGTLQKELDANGNATQYEYNGFGGMKKTLYADGTYTQPGYDAYRRMTSMRTRSGQTITYQFDVDERLDKKILPGNTIDYTYDLVGRISQVTDATGTISPTYDRIGRLTAVEDAYGRTISYEHAACCGKKKKITYPDGSYVTHYHDAAGRLTDINDTSGTNLAHYAYDDLNRRTSITYANGTTKKYS